MENPSSGVEKPSFWKTAPGILTAIAAFITAVGTLIGALYAAGVLGGDDDATLAQWATQANSICNDFRQERARVLGPAPTLEQVLAAWPQIRPAYTSSLERVRAIPRPPIEESRIGDLMNNRDQAKAKIESAAQLFSNGDTRYIQTMQEVASLDQTGNTIAVSLGVTECAL